MLVHLLFCDIVLSYPIVCVHKYSSKITICYKNLFSLLCYSSSMFFTHKPSLVIPMIFTTSLLNQAYQAYRFERDSPVFSHFSVHPVVFNVVPFFYKKSQNIEMKQKHAIFAISCAFSRACYKYISVTYIL